MTTEELKVLNELSERIKSLKKDKEQCEQMIKCHKDKSWSARIEIKGVGGKEVTVLPTLWDTADTISNYIDDLASEIQRLEEKLDNYKVFVPGTIVKMEE